MTRGCQQNDRTLADGFTGPAAAQLLRGGGLCEAAGHAGRAALPQGAAEPELQPWRRLQVAPDETVILQCTPPVLLLDVPIGRKRRFHQNNSLVNGLVKGFWEWPTAGGRAATVHWQNGGLVPGGGLLLERRVVVRAIRGSGMIGVFKTPIHNP